MLKKCVILFLVGCSALLAQLRGDEKVIVTVSKEWDSNEASLFLFERSGDSWRPVGEAIPVHYGEKGLAWGNGVHPGQEGLQKEEGDKRSPAGMFTVGALYGLEERPPEGVRVPYRRITGETRCIDDGDSPLYNQVVEKKGDDSSWTSAEHMVRANPDYKYVLLVEHNRGNVPGNGSCIFLHINNVPTSGCTSMDEEAMVRLLRWLEPGRRTVLVQLPEPEYRRLQQEWSLPPLPEMNP